MATKARRRRRSRTSHSGVKLKQRANGSWVARWTDPLGGAETQQSLTALGLGSEEARVAWAKEKAVSLKSTAAAVAAGTAVAERTTVADAIDGFLEASTATDVTQDGYRPSLTRFREWASSSGIVLLQDVQPHHLTAFREYAVKLPVSASKAGAKRGVKVVGKRVRSLVTTNKTLVVVKALLRWARLRGYLPHVDSDSIRERLKPVRVERRAIEFLRPVEVKALLQASLRYDKATFALTREEHDGLRKPGTTTRYEPVAPLVLLLLLTGMRLMEAVGLQWEEVDLGAEEIRLPAHRVKTRMARTVTLSESPLAMNLLEALRLRTPGERVFPAWTGDVAKATRARLLKDYKAPPFSWQALRRTCAAVGTNAASIFGSASAYRSARRCGHSVAVAEKSYVDVVRNLPATARTFEAAMGIESEAKSVVKAVGGVVGKRPGASTAATG